MKQELLFEQEAQVLAAAAKRWLDKRSAHGAESVFAYASKWDFDSWQAVLNQYERQVLNRQPTQPLMIDVFEAKSILRTEAEREKRAKR